jgi:hypothetical protein
MTNLSRPVTKAEFLTRVDTLCVMHDCSVTSWWRTKTRNERVGGHPKSKHLTGWGVDLVPDDHRWEKKHDIVKDAHTLGLWAVAEEDHVHVQGRRPASSGEPPPSS